MTGRYAVSSGAVTGWYVNPADPADRWVDLFCNEVPLRRLRAGREWPRSSDPHFRDRVCGFGLNLTQGLKTLIPRGARLSVVDAAGRELSRDGVQPEIGEATDGGDSLRRHLEQGWIVDKWGGVKLPFRASPGLDQQFFDFYAAISAKIEAATGLEFYLAYGSLLGYVRDSRLIAHDDDVDCAYLSRFQSIDEVAREFHRLTDVLRNLASKLGFAVGVVNTGQVSIVYRNLHFDIFTSWIDESDAYNCYFGVSGPLAGGRLELERVEFLNNVAKVPVQAERILELTYGAGWRVPDPAFDWSPEPRVQAVMDQLRERGRRFTAQTP